MPAKRGTGKKAQAMRAAKGKAHSVEHIVPTNGLFPLCPPSLPHKSLTVPYHYSSAVYGSHASFLPRRSEPSSGPIRHKHAKSSRSCPTSAIILRPEYSCTSNSPSYSVNTSDSSTHMNTTGCSLYFDPYGLLQTLLPDPSQGYIGYDDTKFGQRSTDPSFSPVVKTEIERHSEAYLNQLLNAEIAHAMGMHPPAEAAAHDTHVPRTFYVQSGPSGAAITPFALTNTPIVASAVPVSANDT
ncbi:hypothetical protein BGZ65_012786, partial [Modicella reniformis]